MLAEVPAERFDAYVEAERRCGERYLGNTGRIAWLVSVAPIAPAELRAFIPEISSPVELDHDLTTELAHGLALALNLWGRSTFRRR